MNFDLDQALQVLAATPSTLRALLGQIDDTWTSSAGDAEQWQPYDIVGHLIHGEDTDWIPRAKVILGQGSDRTFTPFDRLAQFDDSKGKSIGDLLDEFESKRRQSLDILASWELSDDQLALKGTHPELGDVDLRQLLATWVVHDLTHLRQIATVMAKRYTDEVGPWRDYLSILK